MWLWWGLSDGVNLTTPAMLQAFPAALHASMSGPPSVAASKSHVSDTPPPAEPLRTQEAMPLIPQPASQEIPISPVKATVRAVSAISDDKPTTEYTWPNSLLDIDMTSGNEPEQTLLLDKHVADHPAVQRALTSLVIGRTIEQDRDDIMAGVPLPIISEPLLPSLVPLNKEESLLFSLVKPLQGAALVAAAGITADDLPTRAPKADKGKQRSNVVHPRARFP